MLHINWQYSCSSNWKWCFSVAQTYFSAAPFPSPSYPRYPRQPTVIPSFSVCNCVGGFAVVQQRVQHFLWQKSGTYYFVRRVPKDIQEHYTSSRVVICLKTKRRDSAVKASRSIAQRLEDWLSLRLSKLDIPALHLLRDKPLAASTSSSMKTLRGSGAVSKAQG